VLLIISGNYCSLLPASGFCRLQSGPAAGGGQRGRPPAGPRHPSSHAPRDEQERDARDVNGAVKNRRAAVETADARGGHVVVERDRAGQGQAAVQV
jgi:hypothetical protein